MDTKTRDEIPGGRTRRATRRAALALATVLLAGVGMTATASPAHAGPIGIDPDCSNRKTVQTKTTGLTMNVWFYNKDRHKVPASGGIIYRWSYTGTMYTYDVGLRQWTKAGTVTYKCAGK